MTDDYTVIELETTGFSSQFNHIIEVGCIKFRGGKEIDRYQSLIKPLEPIPYVIECMTGIKNADVQNTPTFNEIGMAIWNFLNGELIVGHSVNFDINFSYELSPESRAILSSARMIYKKFYAELESLDVMRWKIADWDAGWYQVRMSLGATIDLMPLSTKLLPQIYDLGFLRDEVRYF